MDAGWFDYDGGLALLAPMVAIGAALWTRRVLASLALGIAVAAWVGAEGDRAGALGVVGRSFWITVTTWDNLKITAFTALVGAMVGVMHRSGLVEELVGLVVARIRGRRGAMMSSWGAGLLVFFDDYANCLVVGSSMGPVCDREGVSRAKLAYIVDSTAAPVASLALVGTWVGYEVGLIEEALAGTARQGQGFALFLSALPFRYYGWFALALVGLVAWTGRDLGPMVAHEREACRQRDPHSVTTARPGRLRALWPPVVLVLVTLASVAGSGVSAVGEGWREVPIYDLLSGAQPFDAMLHGSVAGLVVASALGWRGSELGLRDWVDGCRSGVGQVGGALVVLILAWGLGHAIGETSAQEVLSRGLDGRLDPRWLPASTFLIAAATAFSTGTSFGTMSILIPLAVPLAVSMVGDDLALLSATTAAVLGGACLGDHASPISDTTVLSSAGAGVDVVTHVRTQLPYAALAGGVALLLGHVATGLGGRPWWLLPVGVAAMAAVLVTWGVRPERVDD